MFWVLSHKSKLSTRGYDHIRQSYDKAIIADANREYDGSDVDLEFRDVNSLGPCQIYLTVGDN